MTIEEKKRYLKRYVWLQKQAEAIEEEIETLKQAQASASAPVTSGDHIQGGKLKDPMIDYIIKLLDMEHDLLKLKEERIDLCRDITQAIRDVDDERYRLILFYRYINGKDWDSICVLTGYEASRMFELHGEALSALEIKERSKSE